MNQTPKCEFKVVANCKNVAFLKTKEPDEVSNFLMKIIFFIFLSLLASCSSENYQDCVDQVAKNAKTDLAVALGTKNCKEKHRVTQPQPQDTNKAVITDLPNVCYVYWDGIRFQLGKTEGEKFVRYKRSYYGVPVVEFALPFSMAKELDGDGSKGKEISGDNFNQWMNTNWHQVESLCKFN